MCVMCQQDQAGESILYVAVNADADLQNYTTQLSPLVAAVSVPVALLFSASVGQVHAPENLTSCPPSSGAYPETERTGICKKTSRQQADPASLLRCPTSPAMFSGFGTNNPGSPLTMQRGNVTGLETNSPSPK